MIDFKINETSKEIIPALLHKINYKTKPIGSLGILEKLAVQIGRIQNTLSPELKSPAILVFAGDHGIADEGVSICPQEITYQMVFNFLNGGAGINVFTKQHDIDIKVIDCGVKYDFEPHPGLINAKINYGTKNFLLEPAMTKDECLNAIAKGAEIVREIHRNGCNIIGFGEMGIANTSSASIILSLLCDIPIEKCIGPGAGLDDKGVSLKKEILKKAVNKHSIDKSPFSVLQTFGGFEINMMTGAMLQAAERGMILMIDGFITSSAYLAASKICPAILDYGIFCHKSKEPGHILMAEHLKAEPILDLELRLGEGTGAAIAYPIIKSAVVFINEMASFESAKVTYSY